MSRRDFQVGDFVTVISNTTWYRVGEIAKITELMDGYFRGDFKWPDQRVTHRKGEECRSWLVRNLEVELKTFTPSEILNLGSFLEKKDLQRIFTLQPELKEIMIFGSED